MGCVAPHDQHVDTGAQLPRELFDKMVAAKNFQAGMQTVRQIEFSLFDIRLHSEFDPNGKKTALDLIEEVRDEVAVVRPPNGTAFPTTFPIFLLAVMRLAITATNGQKCYLLTPTACLKKTGVLIAETGQRFWDEILAQGGSRPAMESFIAFRGREPNIDALLRHNGMIINLKLRAPGMSIH